MNIKIKKLKDFLKPYSILIPGLYLFIMTVSSNDTIFEALHLIARN